MFALGLSSGGNVGKTSANSAVQTGEEHHISPPWGL